MPKAKSPYHALDWRHPAGMSFPRVLEQGLARLGTAADMPSGPIYQALAAAAPVYRQDGEGRRRRLRRDGARNLMALLSACLASADLTKGLIATPIVDPATGKRLWGRRTWPDIDGLAYGPLVVDERSGRRTERHARTAVAAGLIRSIPWRTREASGEWSSEPGIKLVTDELWRLLGLLDQVRALRRQRKRQAGQQRMAELAAQVPTSDPRRNRPAKPPAAPAPVPAAAAHVQRGPPDPAEAEHRRDVALRELEKMQKVLGKF